MSDSNGESKAKGFNQANSSAENKSAHLNLNHIIDRLGKAEGDIAALLAGPGKANEAITEYAGDLKKDLRHTNRIKWIVLIFSGLYVIIINILLGYLIFFNEIYFILLGTYTRVAFIFAAVSSSIGLFIAVLRGTFKNSAERHKENYTFTEIKALSNIINPKDMP